jgi:hypothetical protein
MLMTALSNLIKIFSWHTLHCVHQKIHSGTLLSKHSEPNFMSHITKFKSCGNEHDEMTHSKQLHSNKEIYKSVVECESAIMHSVLQIKIR